MVVSRPNKRKYSTFLQSPWHKVYMQGLDLCHRISILEQEWCLVTNTLCEKCDPNEVISPSKRRLVVSTHLMQQLLQPAPAFVFSIDNNAAAFNYEIVLYFVSRITLADSCSLKCRSHLEKSTNTNRTSKTANDHKDETYSSLVKSFKENIQKLESDFQSFEKTTSVLDIILEIQELERFSMINHLGKFYNRAKTITRPIPQQYVLEIPMPVNLPEPLHCLPL
ncbi:hypothetical protein CARUB_v10019362mg [Capsella rubella]|uniref:Uncharacterized protein n=2 Tax=Capsella rubella TaxID=81985 RepID=R0HPW6_9BRAS|nr:hypothetical protein CARUB_v10019362mg [Capsella rubella]